MNNQSLLLVSITDQARCEDQAAVVRIKKELKKLGALEINEASYLLLGELTKMHVLMFTKAASRIKAVSVYSLSAFEGDQSSLQPKIWRLAKEHLKTELSHLAEDL